MPTLKFNNCNELVDSINQFNEYVKDNIDKSIKINDLKQNLNEKIKYSLSVFNNVKKAFVLDCESRYLYKVKKFEYDIIIEIFNELNILYWNLIYIWNDYGKFSTKIEAHKKNFLNEVKYLSIRIYEFVYFLKCIYTEKTGTALRVIFRITFLNRKNQELIKKMNTDTKYYDDELDKKLIEIEIRSKKEHDQDLQVQEQLQERTKELYKAIEEAQAQIRIFKQEKMLILFKAKRNKVVENDYIVVKKIDESDYILVKKIFEDQFSYYIKIGNRDAKITKINALYRLNDDNKQPDELEVIIDISDNEIKPENEIKSFHSYINQEINETSFRNSGNNFLTLKDSGFSNFEVRAYK